MGVDSSGNLYTPEQIKTLSQTEKDQLAMITKLEYEQLQVQSTEQRTAEYNRLIESRQVRRAKARAAKKTQRRNRGK